MCTVRYTLYESATEYGEFAYCLRSIWRHHSDKKYAKLIIIIIIISIIIIIIIIIMS